MRICKNGKKHLKMAILMVNGKSNYNDRLWIELSIGNILRFTSPYTDFKIFLWNHDYENSKVNQFLESVSRHVEVISENTFELSQWNGIRLEEPPRPLNYFGGGFHVHRAPLQILYEYVTGKYDIDILFTFDTDSWPVRNNWEVPLVYRLERDIQLTGIWRDELQIVRPPHIHASCLGIKTQTIKNLNLRFDYHPIPVKEDTLTHFTHIIQDEFSDQAILPLMRSNAKEYHPVFNGIYGGIVYHHHLGSRYREGSISRPVAAGWKERNESPEDNKFLLDASTAMVFEQTDDFIHDLAYGDDAFDFKLYSYYLTNCYTSEAYSKLFDKAKKKREKKLPEAYFISGLISRHFAFNREFLQFYAELCQEMGYNVEAESYYSLIR